MWTVRLRYLVSADEGTGNADATQTQLNVATESIGVSASVGATNLLSLSQVIGGQQLHAAEGTAGRHDGLAHILQQTTAQRHGSQGGSRGHCRVEGERTSCTQSGGSVGQTRGNTRSCSEGEERGLGSRDFTAGGEQRRDRAEMGVAGDLNDVRLQRCHSLYLNGIK